MFQKSAILLIALENTVKNHIFSNKYILKADIISVQISYK